MTYMIIEDGQPMDGELYDSREAVMAMSRYAAAGARIVEFTAPALGAEAIIRDVTKAIATEANGAGVYDNPEYDRQHLAGEFIDFPISRSEAAEARAEQRFEEARDHQAMGWL